jgi:hypothetical protein
MTIVILLPGRTHAKSPLTSEERATLAAAPGRAATKGESGSQAYRARRKGRFLMAIQPPGGTNLGLGFLGGADAWARPERVTGIEPALSAWEAS